ncbi:MAG: VWA domain-containing protein, partial [Deltaproteobacteria bacterium]|nr:VWA domain-containing protein [Deltaproteobacteria bacterium]
NKFKRELLAEVAGMLAFLAIRTNDKVGAILFSSGVEKYIPPKKGASHVWRLIKEIFTFEPRDLNTDIDTVLTYFNRVSKRHAIAFLISDCMDTGFEKSLRLTAKKHDLTVLRVIDAAEEELPDLGLVSLSDPETGQRAFVNTSSKRLKRKWREYHHHHGAYLSNLLRKAGVDLVELRTDGSVVEPLAKLFHKRRSRL